MKDVKTLLSQLSLEEKAGLCSGLNYWYMKGIDRLGIPSIMLTDGPHGLRKQATDPDHVGLTESVPATCFPTAPLLAASWDRELVYQVGQALGEECRQEKVGVLLGPGANIKRSPLGGRNFEYFSEDPCLTGEISASYIQGVQSQGIGTSLKHFAANNQEYRRMTIDAVVDERALREIYLSGFERAVKAAQPWTVMCAYNKLNGTFCCQHQALLGGILKGEWVHAGLVVADWGAMDERVAALKAGCELEMPGTPNGNDELIVAAVRAGQLDETVLDGAVERILDLVLKVQQTLSQDFVYDPQAHHALARRAAAEGTVLLKNEGSLLPLKEGEKIALVGRFARSPRYQGAGSSLMKPTRLDNLYDELVNACGADAVSHAPGYSESGDLPDEALIRQALEAASGADVVVICAGLPDLYETEGLDRSHMRLPPGHDALIQRLAAAHPRVAVVLSNGAPVEMPWAGSVPCILEGYLGGQAGAGALADILCGAVNPSGKLAETFPLRLEDNPSHAYFPGGPATVEYREGIFTGYRYYDTAGREVLFPFGHGLSYTRFEYSGLQLARTTGENGALLTVSFKVRNAGDRPGKEAVQLYVRAVDAPVTRPDMELKGFAKVGLPPGEESGVTIELDRRAFAWYDPALKDWRVDSGRYEVLVGASSRDIRLRDAVELPASPENAPPVADPRPAAYASLLKGEPVSQADFEALLGRPAPSPLGPKRGSYTVNTPVKDMSGSLLARLVHWVMRRQMAKMVGQNTHTPMARLFEALLREMPLRSFLMMGSGLFNRAMLEALAQMINGAFFRGAAALVKAARAKRAK